MTGSSITAVAEAPEFTIPPAEIRPTALSHEAQSLFQAIQARQAHLFFPNRAEYGRFKRVCTWFVGIFTNDATGWQVFYGVGTVISTVASFLTLLHHGGALWLPFLLSMPLGVLLAALACTRDRNKNLLPPWLRAFHARRAREYAAIMTEAEAFNIWARTAQIPPEMQADVKVAADARRKAIHDRMLAYLADMDRALEHRKNVEQLIESRRNVDAAFPEPNHRLTLAVAPRVAMLKTAEALTDEAVELGMPTDELLAVRQLSSGS